MPYMPKPYKNSAFKCLILGTKCCKSAAIFFQSDSSLISNPNWVGRRFDPRISLDSFLGSPGHQNSSLGEAQPIYYFSMVLD